MIKILIATKKNDKHCTSCNRSHYKDNPDEKIIYFKIETFTGANQSNASVMSYCEYCTEQLRSKLNEVFKNLYRSEI